MIIETDQVCAQGQIENIQKIPGVLAVTVVKPL
jgi:nitrate reductase NapAB chaperone NapD